MGQRKIHQEDITHIKQTNLKLYDGKPVRKMQLDQFTIMLEM